MKTPNVKICFLLDCTASMDPWICAAKNRIVSTIDKIQHDFPDVNIQVAFVGYRDYGDDEPFIVEDFTTDIHEIRNRIMNVEAKGGQDICEDVTGGYQKVCQLNWRNATVKHLFHICDAPAHGIRYHGPNVSDDSPNEFGRLEYFVETIADKKIDLTLFRIHPNTDIMYDIIDHTYSTIREDKCSIEDLVGSREHQNVSFERVVYATMHTSIAESTADPIEY